MGFLYSNVTAAIVCAQYDLRGFMHPLGIRMPNTIYIDVVLANFLAQASGLTHQSDQVITYPIIDWDKGTYEKYLAVSQALATECGMYAYEAIQHLIKETVEVSDHLKKEEDGAPSENQKLYRDPMDITNRFGMVVQAMAKAFNVEIKSADGGHSITLQLEVPVESAA